MKLKTFNSCEVLSHGAVFFVIAKDAIGVDEAISDKILEIATPA
ncbi:hypothetical protein [Rickettsia felis]|nr:hypothetical protein [Rickettsia felis]